MERLTWNGKLNGILSLLRYTSRSLLKPNKWAEEEKNGTKWNQIPWEWHLWAAQKWIRMSVLKLWLFWVKFIFGVCFAWVSIAAHRIKMICRCLRFRWIRKFADSKSHSSLKWLHKQNTDYFCVFVWLNSWENYRNVDKRLSYPFSLISCRSDVNFSQRNRWQPNCRAIEHLYRHCWALLLPFDWMNETWETKWCCSLSSQVRM